MKILTCINCVRDQQTIHIRLKMSIRTRLKHQQCQDVNSQTYASIHVNRTMKQPSSQSMKECVSEIASLNSICGMDHSDTLQVTQHMLIKLMSFSKMLQRIHGQKEELNLWKTFPNSQLNFEGIISLFGKMFAFIKSLFKFLL